MYGRRFDSLLLKNRLCADESGAHRAFLRRDFVKNGAKVALTGIICALAVAVMLLTVLPTMQIGLPVIAGALLVVPVLECGVRWGVTGYAATAVLSFLLAPSVESKLLFLLFFGYYPVVKALIERLRARTLRAVIKLALFNGAMILTYFLLLRFTTAVDAQEFTIAGVYLPGVVLACGNAVFCLYDVALSRLIGVYLRVWQPRVRHWLHF